MAREDPARRLGGGAGGTRTVVEPATGDALGEIGLAGPADVSEAVRIGRAAQRDWARAPYTERAAVLRRAGALWEEHAPEIHDWLIREAGSVPGKAAFETGTAAQEYYEAAALPAHPYGELPRSAEPRLSFARRLPVGVVGVIAPFNVPAPVG